MRVDVLIATKGRPVETGVLLDALKRQSLLPSRILVVGATEPDIEGLDAIASAQPDVVHLMTTGRAGLTLQRNAGLDWLHANSGRADDRAHMIACFDDDFRPADTWLERAAKRLESELDIAGVTGRVVADGVNGPGLSEDEAAAYLNGDREPMAHWASGDAAFDVTSLYGCNMAFRALVFEKERFDENLPLYGWQEDRDISGAARRYGRTMYIPECRGVHLGAKGGRTSGVRFGYSQIANMIYLARKGSVSPALAARFVARALAANIVRGATGHPIFDYRGRLSGNMRALIDTARGRCDPRRILDL